VKPDGVCCHDFVSLRWVVLCCNETLCNVRSPPNGQRSLAAAQDRTAGRLVPRVLGRGLGRRSYRVHQGNRAMVADGIALLVQYHLARET